MLPIELALVRLPANVELPDWAWAGEFCSITRSDEELSVVCESRLVPKGLWCEAGWQAIKVQGPLYFDEVGILAELTDVLARRSVSVFVISTYDTDYILVKAARIQQAIDVLTDAGHMFEK